jgi:hypothetical protein
METSSCSVLTILAWAIKGSLLIFQIINPIFIPYKVQTFFICNFIQDFQSSFLFTRMSFCRLLDQSIGPCIYP